MFALILPSPWWLRWSWSGAATLHALGWVLFVGSVVVGTWAVLAIVASTLAIAALFSPLRRRIQGFVDRYFYRSKYDARKTLEALSIKLKDETDLTALSGDLVGMVRQTMQPAHVSLWLHTDSTPRDQ